jgi:hypothetical protein
MILPLGAEEKEEFGNPFSDEKYAKGLGVDKLFEKKGILF